MVLRTLPQDAWQRCSGRVHISISVLDGLRLRNLVVSQFHSNDDLMEACIASSSIPFLSATGFGQRFRGMRVLDGGATKNLPRFDDGLRAQILFKLGVVACESVFASCLICHTMSLDNFVTVRVACYVFLLW